METVTAWRRNRLAQPHSWSHIDKLRVATGCWRSETHFFTEEVKHQGPGSSLETRAPGSPGHILTLNLPFVSPQRFHRSSAWQHQKTEWKMMKNWSRRARIWKSFTVRGRSTLRNPVSCFFFFLCVPFLKDSLFLISSYEGNEWSCTQFSSQRSREGVPAWIPSS